MDMEDVLLYNELYDLYGALLTDKQKEYFEDYYFANLSLSEMAENYEVSRNAIFKQIKIVKEKLDEYESKLSLKKKRETIAKLSESIKDDKLKEKLLEII